LLKRHALDDGGCRRRDVWLTLAPSFGGRKPDTTDVIRLQQASTLDLARRYAFFFSLSEILDDDIEDRN